MDWVLLLQMDSTWRLFYVLAKLYNHQIALLGSSSLLDNDQHDFTCNSRSSESGIWSMHHCPILASIYWEFWDRCHIESMLQRGRGTCDFLASTVSPDLAECLDRLWKRTSGAMELCRVRKPRICDNWNEKGLPLQRIWGWKSKTLSR
jgi:hypothetical protein